MQHDLFRAFLTTNDYFPRLATLKCVSRRFRDVAADVQRHYRLPQEAPYSDSLSGSMRQLRTMVALLRREKRQLHTTSLCVTASHCQIVCAYVQISCTRFILKGNHQLTNISSCKTTETLEFRELTLKTGAIFATRVLILAHCVLNFSLSHRFPHLRHLKAKATTVIIASTMHHLAVLEIALNPSDLVVDFNDLPSLRVAKIRGCVVTIEKWRKLEYVALARCRWSIDELLDGSTAVKMLVVNTHFNTAIFEAPYKRSELPDGESIYYLHEADREDYVENGLNADNYSL